MPKSPQEVLSDPAFQQLPLGEQLKVMRKVDPNFASLSPKDQGTVIAKTRQSSLGYDKIGQKPQDAGFVNTLKSDISSIPSAAAHPMRTLTGMATAQHNAFQKGRDAFKQGDYVSGAGYTAAGALPVLGPMAAQVGEEVGSGQYGQAGAHAAELMVPEGIKTGARVIPFESLKTAAKTGAASSSEIMERLRNATGEVAKQTPGASKVRNVANAAREGYGKATAKSVREASEPPTAPRPESNAGPAKGQYDNPRLKPPDHPNARNRSTPSSGPAMMKPEDVTARIDASRPPVEELPAQGTYEVRDQLKKIGAKWDADKKVWRVPKDQIEKARDIVNPDRVKASSSEYRTRGERDITPPSPKGKLKAPEAPKEAAPAPAVPSHIDMASSAMADMIKRAGIEVSHVHEIPPEGWNLMAQNAGLSEAPSRELIQATLEKLNPQVQIKVRRR